MGFEDLRIRDVSRTSGEWFPPIGALGGPPAHELYRDLVLYAGLQLFQDARAAPWLVFRDGAQRRAFSVPSHELRSALDRFRMRRNSRPLPRNDLEEFVRIVEARVSDPDVSIPVLRSPIADGSSTSVPRPSPPDAGGPSTLSGNGPIPPAGPSRQEREDDTPLRYPSVERAAMSVPQDTGSALAGGSPLSAQELNPSVSGGRMLSDHETAGITRYVRVLRRLLRDGDWMGTTRELSEMIRDDPITLYSSLLRYRAELADNNIILANVDAAEGLRWLVVDGSKIRSSAASRPSTEPAPPALGDIVVRGILRRVGRNQGGPRPPSPVPAEPDAPLSPPPAR